MPDTPQRGRLRPVLTTIAAVLLYALLIDAAIETWQSRSNVGAWVAIPVALYVGFTLWLLRQHGTKRPGAQSSLWVSSFLFLALFAVTATMPGGLGHGMRVAGFPTSTVLSATTIVVIALALGSLTIGSPLPLAGRIVALFAGCYGLAAFATGIALHRSYVQLLQGHSIWEPAPYWLQGAFVGALVVVPLAFVIELGVALAHVRVRGRRHRLLAFALGTVIAYSGFTAEPSAAGRTGGAGHETASGNQLAAPPPGARRLQRFELGGEVTQQLRRRNDSIAAQSIALCGDFDHRLGDVIDV